MKPSSDIDSAIARTIARRSPRPKRMNTIRVIEAPYDDDGTEPHIEIFEYEVDDE
jgi:hypothetical protein